MADMNFTLGLFGQSNGFISSIPISPEDIRKSNGYIEGNFDIAFGDFLEDGWYRLKIRGKGGFFRKIKTYAKSQKFKILRLLDQANLAEKLQIVDGVDPVIEGTSLGQKNGIKAYINFHEKLKSKRKLQFRIIHMESGSPVPRSKRKVRVPKGAESFIVELDLPKEEGKYFIEVSAKKNWFSRSVIYRSRIFEVLENTDGLHLTLDSMADPPIMSNRVPPMLKYKDDWHEKNPVISNYLNSDAHLGSSSSVESFPLDDEAIEEAELDGDSLGYWADESENMLFSEESEDKDTENNAEALSDSRGFVKYTPILDSDDYTKYWYDPRKSNREDKNGGDFVQNNSPFSARTYVGENRNYRPTLPWIFGNNRSPLS